jgi:Glutathione S-transferase, C-terminal domain
MVEEHLYWVLVYSRWTDDAVWEDFKRKLRPTSSPVELQARRELTLRDLHGQGLGRHTSSEVYELGDADLSALSAFLGNKRYVLRERPTSLDATVFAVLATILWPPYESPLKARARTLVNLEPYCRRMLEQYYR